MKNIFNYIHLGLLFVLPLILCSSHNNTLTHDKGVVINGVKWATRNVDKPGTFTEKPEDAGMLYQWNRKFAWNNIDKYATNWNAIFSYGDSWEKPNDPSPTGWRVPTINEIKTLLDTNHVRNEWATENGVNGRKFTDKATGNTLFLPAAGDRDYTDGMLRCNDICGTYGCYWSSTDFRSDDAYYMYLGNNGVFWSNSYLNYGRSVRAVAETEDSLESSKETLAVDEYFEDFITSFRYHGKFRIARCGVVGGIGMVNIGKSPLYDYAFYLYNSHEEPEYYNDLTNEKYLSILKPTENKKMNLRFDKINGRWFMVEIKNLEFDFNHTANFEAFIYQFSTDSIFRNEHIKFPLKYSFIRDNENGYQEKTDYLTKENVFQYNFFDKGDFVFFYDNENSDESRMLLHMRGYENGISNYYYFEKFDDTWQLIEFIDYSL